MCTVAAASGAASVRVWHITSRGWDPWTERPLPEVVRVAYPLPTPKVLVAEDCRECCKRLGAEIANDSSGIPDYVAQFIIKILATDDLPCP